MIASYVNYLYFNYIKTTSFAFKSSGLCLIFLLIFVSDTTYAATPDTTKKIKQDTVKHWNTAAVFGLTFNQLSLTNWASGGESSLSGKANFDLKSLYKKNGSSFEFQNKSAFGVVGYGNNRIEKTEDRFDLSASYSFKAYDSWTYTSLFTFKTQFANGYKYPNDSTLISAFMAPGYLTASLGFKFKKSDHFELFLSPASGKFTLVTNQELANKGAFGVEKAVYDTAGAVRIPGKNVLAEFGVNLLASVNQPITEDIGVVSTLNLYNNYFDSDQENRWNIDVDWETKVNFSISKRLQTVFFLLMKYDHDIAVPLFDYVDGQKKQVGEGPRLQIKESLGIGLSYKIG